MSVNIVVDYTLNGRSVNKPCIVMLTDNVFVAGAVVKQQIEEMGGVVDVLTVVEGNWTIEELEEMANHGKYINEVQTRILYVGDNAKEYIEYVKRNPEEHKKVKQYIEKIEREYGKMKPPLFN